MIHITRISDFSVSRPSWSVIDSSFLSLPEPRQKVPTSPRPTTPQAPYGGLRFRLEPRFLPTRRVANGTTLPDLGPAE
jgi:hypothetical protein